MGTCKAVTQEHLGQSRTVDHGHAHLVALRAAGCHGRLRCRQRGLGCQGLDLEGGGLALLRQNRQGQAKASGHQ
ncbi:MAG: hypothetical protein ACLGG8_10885 [Gammaproteobacteria bacterium]